MTPPPLWRIHRHIGMGGDQLVAALAGEDFDAEHDDDVRAAEKALYLALIYEVRPLEGARELVEDLGADGRAVRARRHPDGRRADRRLQRGGAARGGRGERLRLPA